MMPRFVLLRHDCPPSFKPSHWDFMLERDGALMSWSLDALPRFWAMALAIDCVAYDSVAAVRLADHRIAYLDYEGPVANDRGEVRRCDGGGFQWSETSDHLLRIELCGKLLRKSVVLRQIEGDRWRLETPS